MKVTIYGGPYDGEKYEIPDNLRTIVLPLPTKPSLKPFSRLESSVNLPRAEIPIQLSVNYGYLAIWEKRKEYR